MSESEDKLPELELLSTIGFQGRLRNGLIFHPDKKHIIYAIGHTVMIKDISSKKQYRLHGHTKAVSCIAVSKDGSLLASGQENFMGFKADVIIWDFYTKRKYGSHTVHRVKVEAVGFSCRTKFVISLGGQDCGSVVVWDIDGKFPLCGNRAAPLAGGYANLLCCANMTNDVFVTAGVGSLRVWKVDHKVRKVLPINTTVGHIKREIKCLEIDSNDIHLYCGTASGDILKVCLNLQVVDGETKRYDSKLLYCLARATSKEISGDSPLYSVGVTALALLKTEELLVGTGNGLVCRATQVEVRANQNLYKIVENVSSSVKKNKELMEVRLKELEKTIVLGDVTSIALRGDGHQFFVGTGTSEIYRVSLAGFLCELMYTCHGAPINDIVFPYKCSDVFATCSRETIRVWNLESSQELLRISVANMICYSIFFMRDGRSIISGWEDGKIRAFTPETGKPLYIIHDAHQREVTAIACTSDSHRIVSGGGEGEVRMWEVNVTVQILRGTMKEHKGAITSIRIKSNDQECATSGADGSCIIWDLKKFLRIQVVFANTLFQAVCYGPEECQIISCGTDRKITYYEILDGIAIRSLEGSASGSINALDISDDCMTFVSGGNDKILRVWKYHEGVVTYVGLGHSDVITAVRMAPNKQHIISVGKDGCILRWQYPDFHVKDDVVN